MHSPLLLTPRSLFAIVLLVGLASAAVCRGQARDRAAADLLPPTTIAYAELPAPGKLVDLVLQHPMRARVERLEAWQKGLQTPQAAQLQVGVKFVEFLLGMDTRRILDTLAGQGIYVALDAKTGGLALLARGPDANQLATLRDKLIELARDDARRNKRPDPVKPFQYRGVAAHDLNGLGTTVLGSWLVVFNNLELGQAIVDRWLADTSVDPATESSLAQQPRFQSARQWRPESCIAWAFIDIESLRDRGAVPLIYAGKTENIVAELLVGGLYDTLKHTPHASAWFDLGPEGVTLQFQLPHEAQWITSAREHYFGAAGTGAAPAPLVVPDELVSLRFHRDLSRMWRRSDELLITKGVDDLAQANSGLSTLFGGKDFGEEVLGLLSPRMQFIATRDSATRGYPRPATLLPAFALVFEMRDPDITRRELRRTFQSVIGFLNIVGAMNGQPQLELDVEKTAEGELVTSSYIPDKTRDVQGQARINFNFSPTAGFAGSRFVLASTHDLASRLQTAATATADPGEKTLNTRLLIQAAVLRELLSSNRESLISRNVLEQGQTRSEAEQQVAAFLEIVGFFRDASLTLWTEPGRLTLQTQVRVTE